MSLTHSDKSIDADFPNTATLTYSITSCINSAYNCIAWAVGKTTIKYWPHKGKVRGCYWPADLGDDDSLAAFIKMFNLEGGYEEWEAENSNIEEGYEKIAIYIKNGKPSHAARQLADGRWTSKIGEGKDIVHSRLELLESGPLGESIYGRVAKILRRPRKESPVPPVCLFPSPYLCKRFPARDTTAS